MRKEQVLHAASDYLPFLGMLLPTLLLVAAAAVSMAGTGRAADTPRAIESMRDRGPASRPATEQATRQAPHPLLKCAAWGEGQRGWSG